MKRILLILLLWLTTSFGSRETYVLYSVENPKEMLLSIDENGQCEFTINELQAMKFKSQIDAINTTLYIQLGSDFFGVRPTKPR